MGRSECVGSREIVIFDADRLPTRRMLHRQKHWPDALCALPGDEGGVATAAGFLYSCRYKVLFDPALGARRCSLQCRRGSNGLKLRGRHANLELPSATHRGVVWRQDGMVCDVRAGLVWVAVPAHRVNVGQRTAMWPWGGVVIDGDMGSTRPAVLARNPTRFSRPQKVFLSVGRWPASPSEKKRSFRELS